MVQKVKKGILEEAKGEAQRIIKGARQEAKAVLKEAQVEAKAEEVRLDKELQGTLSTLEMREIASGKFLARKKVLVRKKKIIDNFFNHCLEAAEALPSKMREQHVRTLLSHAQKHFSVSTAYISKKDKHSLPSMRHEVSADILGGLMAENADASQRIDFTYRTLLEHLRTTDLREIAEELFKE